MNYRAEHNACGWSSPRHRLLSDAERAAIEHWNTCPEGPNGRSSVRYDGKREPAALTRRRPLDTTAPSNRRDHARS